MNRERRFGRAVLGAAVLCLAPWVGPGDLTAQSEETHSAAAERIVARLLGPWPERDSPSDGGAWGLVVGRFSKGDEKVLEFSASVGETYHIVGVGLDGADVDIRLFDP